MKCDSCGASIPEGSKFCGSCGAPIAAPMGHGPAPPQPESSAPKGPPESKITTVFLGVVELLLWIGFIGIIAALLIPTLTGHPDKATVPGGGFLGILLIAYLLAKLRHAKTPWLWVVAAGLLLSAIHFTGSLQALHRNQDAEYDLRKGP